MSTETINAGLSTEGKVESGEKGNAVPPIDKVAAKAEKPSDPLEAEIAEKMGEEWGTLNDKIKARIIESEKKTRDADKKYQQIARIQKEYDLTSKQMAQLVNQLKTDPLGVLKNPALGHDLRKLAEGYVWERIEEDRLDPKERENRQLKSEMAEIKRMQEENKKAQEKEEMEKHISNRREQLEKLIMETCKTAQLPAESPIISRMAYYIQLYRRAGHDLTGEVMADIANRTRQDFKLWTKKFFEADPDEKLLEDLDGPLIERLRKADLKRLKAKGLKVGEEKESGGAKPKQDKRMNMSEWLDQREARMGRK